MATAFELGYCLVDTAENYANEVGVGRSLRASGVPRAEAFVTTKLNAEWHGVREVREAFERSAARLGVDYIDLFLITGPIRARTATSRRSAACSGGVLPTPPGQ